jgi:hypothetical protein
VLSHLHLHEVAFQLEHGLFKDRQSVATPPGILDGSLSDLPMSLPNLLQQMSRLLRPVLARPLRKSKELIRNPGESRDHHDRKGIPLADLSSDNLRHAPKILPSVDRRLFKSKDMNHSVSSQSSLISSSKTPLTASTPTGAGRR